MLGKLAKWLRILGYDTLYSNSYRDEELARIADLENRYLLTRDRELLTKYRVKRSLLVNSNEVLAQLRELKDKLHIQTGESFLSRCVSCNHEIVETFKEDVVDEVPRYVYTTQSRFYRCSGCDKIYWSGTHVTRMRKRLQETFQLPE